MSDMYEQAKLINRDLLNLFGSFPMAEFSLWQKEQILNILIRFGRVAKFRCRSNIAYENFCNSCFSEIATIVKQSKTLNNGEEYETFRASIHGIQAYFDFLTLNKLEDTKENFTKWAETKGARVV